MTDAALFPTSEEKTARLRRLIRAVYGSKESNFYKNIWGDLALKNREIDFVSLPVIGIKDIVNCRFDERLYIKSGLFVKIIYHDDVPYLLARTKSDIRKENYGRISYKRPLVVFESSHESIEKGLWLHDKYFLPLVAEDNFDITLMIAGRYEIDSIVGDTESIKKIIANKSRHFDYKKIVNITIVDSRLEEQLNASLENAFPSAEVQTILSLPETGSLALLCEKNHSGNFIFHPSENSVVEMGEDGHLIATRLILLPTPLIKYKTAIKIKTKEGPCSCGSELSFSLQN